MRLFVAVDLPEAIRAALKQLIQKLRAELPDLRWVRPEGIHITLKFLGEVSEADASAVRRELEASVPGCAPPFDVRIAGMGTFPDNPRQRPRVLWAGVGAERGSLATLQQRVEEACARAGQARERRPFAPHLTLARVGDSGPPPTLAQVVWAYREIDLGGFSVDGVTLFQSILGPQGATYRNLGGFAL